MSNLTQRLAAKNADTGLNIISLFDGMSCGMLAAVGAGIKVANYLASEIEKAPMAVSEVNWGDRVTQIGNVLDAMGIITKPGFALQDLLVGGSPCQDFSMAGKRKGASVKNDPLNIAENKFDELKQKRLEEDDLNFEMGLEEKIAFDEFMRLSKQNTHEVTTLERYLELKADGVEFEGQSYLFWEYVRVLRELQKQNPDIYFMLENVKMAEKWENVISEALDVTPVLINSARVSAQSRKRLYWTNISFDRDIKDRGIMLADILDLEISEDDLHSDKCIAFMNKKVPDGRTRWEFGQHSETAKGKSACLTKSMYKGAPNNCLIDTRPDIKIYQFPCGNNAGGILDTGGKCPTMTSSKWQDNCKVVIGENFENYLIRRFTVAECEKLQTVPVGYCASVAKTHAYKMIGNGWTIEVIIAILRGILNPSTKPHHQPRKPFIQQDLFTTQSPTKEYAHG